MSVTSDVGSSIDESLSDRSESGAEGVGAYRDTLLERDRDLALVFQEPPRPDSVGRPLRPSATVVVVRLGRARAGAVLLRRFCTQDLVDGLLASDRSDQLDRGAGVGQLLGDLERLLEWGAAKGRCPGRQSLL
jgi:hypothetical protein